MTALTALVTAYVSRAAWQRLRQAASAERPLIEIASAAIGNGLYALDQHAEWRIGAHRHGPFAVMFSLERATADRLYQLVRPGEDLRCVAGNVLALALGYGDCLFQEALSPLASEIEKAVPVDPTIATSQEAYEASVEVAKTALTQRMAEMLAGDPVVTEVPAVLKPPIPEPSSPMVRMGPVRITRLRQSPQKSTRGAPIPADCHEWLLREWRHQIGWSQRDLQTKLGMNSRGLVAEIERGKRGALETRKLMRDILLSELSRIGVEPKRLDQVSAWFALLGWSPGHQSA